MKLIKIRNYLWLCKRY